MEKENFIQYLKRKGLELKEWWTDPKTQRAFANAGIILSNSEYPRPGTGAEALYLNAIREEDPEVREKQNAILTSAALLPTTAIPGSQAVYSALGLMGIYKGGEQYLQATKNKDEKAQNDAIATAILSVTAGYASGLKLPTAAERAAFKGYPSIFRRMALPRPAPEPATAEEHTSGLKLPKAPKRQFKVKPASKEPTKNADGLFILEKENPNIYEGQTPLYDGYPDICRRNIRDQETTPTYSQIFPTQIEQDIVGPVTPEQRSTAEHIYRNLCSKNTNQNLDVAIFDTPILDPKDSMSNLDHSTEEFVTNVEQN